MRYHVNHYILKPVTRKKIEELENILLELYHARESSRAKLLELTDNSYQQEIASALLHLEENAEFYQSQTAYGLERVRRFSWENTAREILNIYKEILA